jgi:ABC-2 type transport system ATP-binding protein
MDTPAVLVRDLTKRFPEADALHGVSLEVRRGEILGLLGPNGAGKTTTLHVLLGLVRPTTGQVQIFCLDTPPRKKR